MENEILDYVMETPGNTNPAILKQMLDANSGGGGGGAAVFEYLSTDFDTDEYSFVSSTFDIDDIEEAFFSGKPVMIKFPATDYTGEAMTILESYGKLTEGSVGSPNVIFAQNGNGISFSRIDENGKVCFSVYID